MFWLAIVGELGTEGRREKTEYGIEFGGTGQLVEKNKHEPRRKIQLIPELELGGGFDEW